MKNYSPQREPEEAETLRSLGAASPAVSAPESHFSCDARGGCEPVEGQFTRWLLARKAGRDVSEINTNPQHVPAGPVVYAQGEDDCGRCPVRDPAYRDITLTDFPWQVREEQR